MAKHELELSARHLPAEIQAVHDFIDSGIPENTIKNYSGALNRLSRWLDDRQLNDASLASYLTSLFAQGHAKASAVLVVSAVNKMAKANNQPSPVGGLTKRLCHRIDVRHAIGVGGASPELASKSRIYFKQGRIRTCSQASVTLRSCG